MGRSCPCFVSSPVSPTAHYPNRDDPTVLVRENCGAPVRWRVEREAIATLRLKTGWHGLFWIPFGTTCHWYTWKLALQDRLQWATRRVFHFGSTSQRLALTKAYVDGVFTALNRHSGLLVVVLCLTGNSQVTEESRPIDRFDLLAMKYQAFDRGPLRRYHREL